MLSFNWPWFSMNGMFKVLSMGVLDSAALTELIVNNKKTAKGI